MDGIRTILLDASKKDLSTPQEPLCGPHAFLTILKTLGL